jgi:hypothetical protein
MYDEGVRTTQPKGTDMATKTYKMINSAKCDMHTRVMAVVIENEAQHDEIMRILNVVCVSGMEPCEPDFIEGLEHVYTVAGAKVYGRI